jgi:hypothetical protein
MTPEQVEQWYRKWMKDHNKGTGVVTLNVLDMLKDFAAERPYQDVWVKKDATVNPPVKDGVYTTYDQDGESREMRYSTALERWYWLSGGSCGDDFIRTYLAPARSPLELNVEQIAGYITLCLSDDQRKELMDRCCTHCGSLDPKCVCHKDE